MRRVAWKTVFERAVQLCGFSTDRITVDDREFFEAAIDQRARWAWETEWWPEITPIEKRYYRNAFDAATLYASGDEVYWTDGAGDTYYYRRLSAGSGDLPSDTAKWSQLSAIDAYIDLQQSGRTKIGEVRSVNKFNPRTANYAHPLNWELGPNGIQIVETSPVSVFVEFRKEVPSWSGPDFDATETLAIGDVRYSSSYGDFFEALVAGTGGDLSNPAQFSRIAFPKIFEPFVARSAFADWLNNSGHAEKAARQERMAEKFLEREQHKLTGQQRQSTRSRVFSTGSRSRPRRLT